MNIGVTTDFNDVFNNCDSGCPFCDCGVCKQKGTDEIKKQRNLYEACEEDRVYFKNIFEDAERDLKAEQILYEKALIENNELREKLRQCCPDNPCDGIDCGQHGICNQGECECEENYSGDRCETYRFQCPENICINEMTGFPREQCDSVVAPYVCYNTSQSPFMWGCYSDSGSALSACNNNVCDTRTCNPRSTYGY
jgi:hypothetical protein